MCRNASISAAEVQKQAASVLLSKMRFRDYGRVCTGITLISVALYAVARRLSLSESAHRLKDGPSDETVRKAVLAQVIDEESLQQRINKALVAHFSPRWLRRPVPVAIDLHWEPYYGDASKTPGLMRGLRHQGTTNFFVYATACIVQKGQRFTVGGVRALPETPLAVVVRKLLRAVRSEGVKIRYVLADSQFFTAEIVRYLQASRTPFVIPVAHRGRTPKIPENSKGTRRFLSRKRSGWDKHSWQGREAKATVPICVCVYHFQHRKRQGRQRKVLVFACWGVPQWTPYQVRQIYRRRFGIETSYRQFKAYHIPTATRDALVRFLLFVVALLVRNVWVWFHWWIIDKQLRQLRSAERQALLRFEKMMHLLERFVESVLGGSGLLYAKLQP